MKIGASPYYTGLPAVDSENADTRVYWGIKTADLPISSSASSTGGSDSIFRSNAGGITNELLNSYSKLLGLSGLDALVTGSSADNFSNNKFSLARVALNNQADATSTLVQAITTALTGTAADHMKEAAYIRNKMPTGDNLLINDTTNYSRRLTFASLAAFSGSAPFNTKVLKLFWWSLFIAATWFLVTAFVTEA